MRKKKEAVETLISAFADVLSDADIKKAVLLSNMSAKIIEKRLELNMTQKEFADYLGVSQSMVSKWEGEDYNFTVGSLVDIFDKLDVEFDITFKKPTELAVFAFAPPRYKTNVSSGTGMLEKGGFCA